MIPQDVNDRNYHKYRETSKGTAVAIVDDSLPIDGNNSSVSITVSTHGFVTTTTISKAIGQDTYQKTIVEDSSDNSTVISKWSKI